jgi:2-C-methyl-D-erythritol 2,4-cyclodiphosphate synthase
VLYCSYYGRNMESKLRIGIGYDMHPLVKKRKLVLGGVEIPFAKGLEGWSDADVLSHAIIDALLGAAALGDIGQHFPPGEAQYKDISSLELLKTTGEKLADKGWRVVNIDATVIAEEPKLSGYIEKMRQKLSQALAIDIARVSVKASTANGVGCLGKGKWMEAQAVALISGD